MYSLIDLTHFRSGIKRWGGYVLECKKNKAIYIGMSSNLDRRLEQHRRGHNSSRFVRCYGGALRVLELHFCDTEAQARQWERDTASQLYGTHRDRPVYYPGLHLRRIPVSSPVDSGTKELKSESQAWSACKHGQKHDAKNGQPSMSLEAKRNLINKLRSIRS